MDQQTRRTEEKKEQEEAEHICLQKEKEEAEWHVQKEEKQAEILKMKQLEDEICKKVLAGKKQKEVEAADDGVTPLKKAKKTTKSGAATKEEFTALILSPSKRKACNTINQAENEYKMLCKQKQKLMFQVNSFLNMEHGE